MFNNIRECDREFKAIYFKYFGRPEIVKPREEDNSHGELFQWDGNIEHLPIAAETRQLIIEGRPKGKRSNGIMTVVNALVWANLTDRQIFQIFETYAIGEKWRTEHRSKAKWLERHIEKARDKVTKRAEAPKKREDRNTPEQSVDAECLIKTYNMTDLGNAERFASQHQGEVRCCHPWDKYFIWTGKFWQMDNTAGVVRKAKQTVRSIYTEAQRCDDDMRKALAKWARSSESRSKIDAMIALAKSEPGIPVEPQDLDRDQWLLNCLNGTLDLRTGDLRPHNPEQLITKIIPVACDPNAKAPTWDNFLDRSMAGNRSLITFLQRAVGYSLTGDDSEQCLFLLYGTGANGKSTFLDVIKALLAGYAKQAEFSTFLLKKSEMVRNDIADLRGARFVSAVEAESGQRLAESMVKAMTGGDTLKARFLFKEYFEFAPTFKIFLAANHKPTIKGTDHAIWRRIRLIPFTVTIPEGERDPRLKDKLRAELPGILNWALIGCAEWQEEGIGMPDEIRDATNAYRDEMDVLSEFINESCLVDVRCRVPKPDLYAAYEKWCSQNGEDPLGKKSFRERLVERGFQDDRTKHARIWKGIGLYDRSQVRLVTDGEGVTDIGNDKT